MYKYPDVPGWKQIWVALKQIWWNLQSLWKTHPVDLPHPTTFIPYDKEGDMWQVMIEPRGNNPSPSSKNEGGMIVYLTNGKEKHEVRRVAFERKNSINPKKKFDAILKEIVGDAQTACAEANKLQAELDDKVKQMLKQNHGYDLE